MSYRKVVKMFKNKKPLIQFVSTVEGLDLLEDVAPKPAKSYVPDWFKNMPNHQGSVKQCPALPDFFSQGFVIPMWMDSDLVFDSETSQWGTGSSPLFQDWTAHGNQQLLDYANAKSATKQNAKFVFKAICPWKIITPPGYSVMQLPLYYDFNSDFSVLPGIIDTDIHHEINQQVLFVSNEKKITIKRGDPLAVYIHFKRTKYEMQTRAADEKDIKKFKSGDLFLSSVFVGNGAYRKMQRQRDKGNKK